MIGCRPLSAAELDAVSAQFRGFSEHRDRLLFWLGCTSGFRVSELLSIRLGDLWQDARIAPTLRIRRRHTKGKHAGKSAPIAPLITPYALRWMADFTPRHGSNPKLPLFISREAPARPITRVQAHRILSSAYARAGLFGGEGELATHCMRKTYAARMYDHFKDIFKVQQALRHCSPASTVAYLSFAESELVQAVSLVWPSIERPLEPIPSIAGNIVHFERKNPA